MGNESSISILVVANDDDTRELLGYILNSAGYTVELARTASQVFQKIKENTISLVLIEQLLPETTGTELIRMINQETSIPALLLVNQYEAEEILAALEAGADDFLLKPFERTCLLTRVRNVLRQFHSTDMKIVESAGKVSVGQLVMDVKTYDVFTGTDRVQLTPSEFKLLYALVENRGKVLTREKLIGLVQGAGIAVIDRAIDTHIFGLRKKLGTHSEVVETVRGVGYRVSDTFSAS